METKLKPPFPCSIPGSILLLHFWLLYVLLALSRSGRWGMGIAVSLCCSFLLTHFFYSNLLREHLKHGSFPWACSPSDTPASSCVPLHGPQCLPGAGCCVSSPQAAASLTAREPAVVQGFPQVALGISALYLAAVGQPPSPQFSPLASGQNLPRHLEHLLPIILLWPWCVPCCFSRLFFYFPNYVWEWSYFLTTIA